MYYSPKDPVITVEAKLWVQGIACTKPREHGYAAELWSYSKLAEQVRKHSIVKGYECLEKAVKVTIFRILNEANIKHHKIKYDLEKRDENLEEKWE